MMQKFKKDFIRTFTWGEISEITSDDKWLYDSNFRIVHVINCPGISDFKNVLCENDRVKDVLIKSEYLFCLIVQVETIDESILDDLNTTIKNIFFESGKHFLIEFYDSFAYVQFIFKQRNVTHLKKSNNNDDSATGGQNDEQNDEIGTRSVNSLVEFGLEGAKYEKYITDATQKCDCLFIRILKSFNIPIRFGSEKAILKKLVTESHEAVKAYLDLPIIEANNENSISPNALTKKILNFNYLNGKSLLHCAVEGPKVDVDVVNLLLRLGFDIYQVAEEGRTVTDFCEYNEILKFLLNNDAKFPINFSSKFGNFESCSGSKRDIFDIAVDRRKLHEAIKSENEDEVLAFRKKYSNLRMAYIYMDTEPHNQSATTTSLKKTLVSECLETEVEADRSQSKFQFYAFLFRNGFRDDFTAIVNLKLAAGLQEAISRILLNDLKYFQPSHIGYLRNKTKIGTVVDAEGCQVIVDEIYKHINDAGGEEVNTLLKILEHSQFLTIVIDFHSKSVNPMCRILDKTTDGITFHNDGYIYVGAKDKSVIQIAATLAHELSHFAIHIAFDNACYPYYDNDNQTKETMTAIVRKIKEASCRNKVINSVFRYDENLWPRELIVRVPELIILGEKNLFDDEKYKILFDFYKNHVLSAVENIIRKPEDFRLSRDVEQLNCYLGHIEQIKCFKGRGIWPNKTQLPSRIQTAHSLLCSIPNLLLADIFVKLIEPSLISSANKETEKSYFILASVDDFQVPTKKQRILRSWKSSSDVTLILNCENYYEMFLQQSSFFEELNKNRKIILFGSIQTSLLRISPNVEPVIVQYSWEDIDTNYIEILFQREICFQGANVVLNSLIGTDRNVATLEQLINDRPIKVETFKVAIDNYDDFTYVDRRFTTYINVDNLLSHASNKNKTFLLSGVSGCGKSIIFSRICLKIKEKNQHFWVSRINLHEWGETFHAIDIDTNDASGQMDSEKFLTNILVQTDDVTDREFQQELFKKLYQNKKVILLFDAYDELDLKYRETFDQFIQQLGTNIQIWISTRPRHIKDLEKFSNENYVSLELEKFSIYEFYNCAMKFWQHNIKLPNNREIELKLKKCAEVMFSLFQDSVKAFMLSDFFKQPAIIVTLAERYQQSVEKFISSESEKFTIDYVDAFDVFKSIVTKKVLILYRQKGSGIATETAEDFLYQDVVTYLEHRSLLSRFGKSVANNFDGVVEIKKYYYFNVVEQTNEFLNGLLQRSGLISISIDIHSRPIYFLDDMVSDFFVANFVLRKLRRITCLDKSISEPEFDAAMKVLCMNVIHPVQDCLTLITFIDEGLKRFWDRLSENVFDKLSVYLNRTREITFEFERNQNFLKYLLCENAIFLLTFFIMCFSTMTSRRFILIESSKFGMKKLFSYAAEMGVFCIVALLLDDLRLLVHNGKWYLDAFKRAFLYFPESKVAVVKDNTTFNQLKNALTSSNEFDKTLQKLIEGKFLTSTLCVLADICKEAIDKEQSSQDELNWLIKFEKVNYKYDYEICVDFFEEYLEMKWNVLRELGYHASTWIEVTKTLFGTIVEKIFCNYDNISVLNFYKWAFGKKILKNSFKDFVEDTIVRYLHRCHSMSDVIDEIFQFIRQEVGIDIARVYRHRDLPENFDAQFPLDFLPICKQYFTKAEFIAFLTCKDKGENYFEFVLKNETSDFEDVLLTLHHFRMDDTEIMHTIQKFCNITAPNAEGISRTIYKTILSTLRERFATGRGKLKTNQIINSIENIFSNLLRDVFQVLDIHHTLSIFQSASLHADMYVMNEVWQIAKRIKLTDVEMNNLLLANEARVRKTVIREGESRFYENPPTIYNTYCERATYQFMPFNRRSVIPKYAVRYVVDENRSTYIGLLNDDRLCQITFCGIELLEIKTITCDSDLNGNVIHDIELEILTGKGVEWSDDKMACKMGAKLKFNGLHLWANEHGHITLQKNERCDEHTLIRSSSFNDISDETIIYYKIDYRRSS